GNKDKQILKFDPEIERTLCKLRKQSKQTHKISSEEVFEEVFDNMATEGTQEKTLGENSRENSFLVFLHESFASNALFSLSKSFLNP
ncbi:hypothetical protein PIB30_093828, partial [Stylosanthes scabra]|nr:hypothetical protein [Stylosanthes scabra]